MTATVIDARAGRHGAALIAALHAACFDAAWEEAAVVQALALPGTQALVIPGSAGGGAAEPEPAGFALFRVAAEAAEIIEIGVCPAFRGRGLGRALLAACLERTCGLRVRTVYLEAAESNWAARDLYRGAGFNPIGRQENYYSDANNGEPGEDALIFRMGPEFGPAGTAQALRMRSR